MKRRKVRTCDTCKHQPECDVFFARRYERLGLKEPEAFRTLACKLYQKRG